MSESLIKSGSFANLLKADRAVFLNFSLVYLLDFEKDIKFEFFFSKVFHRSMKKDCAWYVKQLYWTANVLALVSPLSNPPEMNWPQINERW